MADLVTSPGLLSRSEGGSAKGTPRAQKIRKEIYYTVNKSRSLSRTGGQQVDSKVISQCKRRQSTLERDPSTQTMMETIADGRLEKLARAHYRGGLRG